MSKATSLKIETPLKWRRIRSVRVRLLAIALLPMLVVMPLLLAATIYNWSTRFDNLLIAKVNGELTIAHQYLSRILESSGTEVQALADSAQFQRTLAQANDTELANYLHSQRQKLGLDFLYLVTEDGNISSSPRTAQRGDVQKWPVVQKALNGQHSAVIDIFSAQDLSFFSYDLADQARLDLVPTEAAVPSRRTEETRGMVVHTAAAITAVTRPAAKGPAASKSAALVGGLLLNRNLDFIDTINDLVYPTASLTEGSRGTATLFLDDVRVSTNVRLFENVRALGTRVSAIVRSTVLDDGAVWLDRAFVVNDWYISAYEPIIDSFGTRVGMLYVGFLDTPFQLAKRQTILTISIAFLLIVGLSVPIFLRWARSIFKPLERMLGAISRVEDGDLGARSGVGTATDEIGRVAAHLDELLDQLEERDQRLRSWASELNDRVADRTRELREANQRLEATTQQLIVSEKLAAIGEITAGIAHEINNPIAVIQGNLDVIQQEIGIETYDLQIEFKLIHEQVHNVNILVNKLLQFARPEEFAGFVDNHPPDEVINDCIPLVQHLLNKVAIDLQLDLNAHQLVSINRTELQQVLINLIVNAIHAMPDGGRLTLRSLGEKFDNTPGVRIDVQDSGSGIDPLVLARVFDPFFTTKEADGTGLGLSISQKLVSRAGGRIKATSPPNTGTCFSIWLPSDDVM